MVVLTFAQTYQIWVPPTIPWVGCEKNLETLELVVLMLLMLYKVVLKTAHKHQPTNKKLSFASCLKKFSGFDFVKKISF